MVEVFDRHRARWGFRAIVPDILVTTDLPLPQEQTVEKAATKDPLSALCTSPRHDAAYWQARTGDFDFSVEDRLDSARYNRILWRGLVGERPASSFTA